MSEPKTKRTAASVADFLEALEDEQLRADCQKIAQLMQEATQAKPEMWGTGIVGFGAYRCRYADGSERDSMLTAFAPRQRKITLYLMPGFDEYDHWMTQLGKHSAGKSCVHIRRLADINLPVLDKIIKGSVEHLKRTTKKQ